MDEALFPCSACGECCRRVGLSHETRFLATGTDTTCRYLDESRNLCSIYENRPDVCRIDRFYADNLQNFIGKRRFYEENAALCNKWQEESGLPLHYRVVIE